MVICVFVNIYMSRDGELYDCEKSNRWSESRRWSVLFQIRFKCVTSDVYMGRGDGQ